MNVVFLDIVHPALEEMLTLRGFNCTHDYTTPAEKLAPILAEAEGIVLRSRVRLNKQLLDLAPNLKFIARSGSGLENIDVDYCRQKSILVYNSPEGNKDAVGEHVIGMLLALFNNLNRADQEVRKGIWNREQNRGVELGSMTVGIIGAGNTGSALMKKLSGFDCEILVYDKYVAGFSSDRVKEVSLEVLKKESDVISIHVPYNEETHYMLDKAFFDSLGKRAYIVNTSRGKCLNTNDLLEALNSGVVAGACLDVFEYELFSFEKILDVPSTLNDLFKSEKVILSPHIAGWTVESNKKLATVLGDKILSSFKPYKEI
jgi:D-3-phosphoglycerate dehydrogenase